MDRALTDNQGAPGLASPCLAMVMTPPRFMPSRRPRLRKRHPNTAACRCRPRPPAPLGGTDHGIAPRNLGDGCLTPRSDPDELLPCQGHGGGAELRNSARWRGRTFQRDDACFTPARRAATLQYPRACWRTIFVLAAPGRTDVTERCVRLWPAWPRSARVRQWPFAHALVECAPQVAHSDIYVPP